MPLDAFTSSTPLTFGVELELQLVNLSDFNLTAASPDLMHLLERKPFPGNVTPEITESMIEINSSVHTSYGPLLAELTEIRDTLVAASDTLNIGIAGGGTHPFQHWSDQRISAKPRYEYLSQLYGYLAKQFTVFGQHVHIGCANGDDAMYLLHALNRYLPHFIALSASSPFVQGHDSLFESARLNSVFAFPMSGRAPFTLSWQEFTDVYFAKMERTNIIKSMKDFYWDLRPKPEFGTIELRVCDTPLTVERAAALAAYLQTLCRHLLERKDEAPAEDDYLVYNYNRFQACRFGVRQHPFEAGWQHHAPENLREHRDPRRHFGHARTDAAARRSAGQRRGAAAPGCRRARRQRCSNPASPRRARRLGRRDGQCGNRALPG
jgi:carboxylate-amine ligase